MKPGVKSTSWLAETEVTISGVPSTGEMRQKRRVLVCGYGASPPGHVVTPIIGDY